MFRYNPFTAHHLPFYFHTVPDTLHDDLQRQSIHIFLVSSELHALRQCHISINTELSVFLCLVVSAKHLLCANQRSINSKSTPLSQFSHPAYET